jgi:hypothetical protein
MEDAVNESVGTAVGELGIAGGFFILLIVLLVGGYRLAMQYMVNLGKKKTSATPSPAKPAAGDIIVGTATMMGIAKDEVETARAQARDILAGHKADLDEFKQVTRDKLKVIDDKDTEQEKDLKKLVAKVIALEEWRKAQDKKD